MTVAELIEKLKTFPPEMQVVFHGHDGGYNHARSVAIKHVAFSRQGCCCDEYAAGSAHATKAVAVSQEFQP